MAILRAAFVAFVVAVVAAGVYLTFRPPNPPAEPTSAVRLAADDINFVTVSGQPATIATPHKSNGLVVVYVHGFTGDERTVVASKKPATLTAALLRAGYTVVSSQAHGNAWGNDTSVQDVSRLARTVARDRPIVVIGQSMGGLAALRSINWVDAVAFVGIFPVCNARTVSRDDEFQESFAAAWRSPTVPEKTLSPVPAPKEPVPMLFFASDADTVVDPQTNARLCAETYRSAGSRVDYVATEGDHNDWSAFQPARIVQWLKVAAAPR